MKKDNSLKLNILLIKNTLGILSKKRKKELLCLLLIAPATSFFDSLSLLIIGPFLSVISGSKDVNIVLIDSLIKKLINLFNLSNLHAISLVFILSVVISNIFRLVQLYITNIYSASLESEISTKTFSSMISNNYENFIQDTSSFNLSILVNQIASYGTYIKSFLQLITSSFISISILLTLLLIDAKVFILSFLFFSFVYVLITFKYQNLVKNFTLKEVRLREKQIKITQESLSSIKDIILGNSYSTYIGNYKQNDFPMRRIASYLTYLILAPKFIIEIIALSFIGFITLFTNASSLNESSLIALGTLGLGAQRFLPLLQIIFSSWLHLNASSIPSSEVFKVLNKSKVKMFDNKKIPNYEFKKSIEFKKVYYSYPYQEKKIIKNINLEISKGEIIGVIGKTGAGKTTFIDLLIGLLSPSSGGIFIDNKLISNQDLLNSWRYSIGHVPQQTFLIDDTISANIAFGINKQNIDFKRIIEVSKVSQIYDFISNLPNKFDTKVGERGVNLSGGQAQRISIARALYKNAKLLVFDEATNSLDTNTELDLIKSLHKFKHDMTIIMITHRLENLSYCDRVIKFEDGKIVSDTKGV